MNKSCDISGYFTIHFDSSEVYLNLHMAFQAQISFRGHKTTIKGLKNYRRKRIILFLFLEMFSFQEPSVISDYYLLDILLVH